MQEEKIRFPSRDITLEGLLHRSPDKAPGVIITHPHPLYGGDMYNPVVECVQQACRDAGRTTLRFNFRGTGKSQGSHDHGVGEQDDVRAAISYLLNLGVETIHLLGYSFGAWVNAGLSTDAYDNTIMVSPPVAFINYGTPRPIPGLTLVVAGEEDDIAPPEMIRPMLLSWNSRAALEIIPGADHFFWGYLDQLKSLLTEHLRAGSATSSSS
ncbi:Hydrolase, alpha/beta fold family [Olavius algarvensis associated proteobacterium Delta 3]|nr:Hydrolase, alpha/beta fold family [Olavius algarvensis associated proteobacterium Delta 3]CAB5117489.1 Hydrolase, alpha/beta fold family [Olavius algarvensis associated proteobacterium Delta 3]